MKAIFSGLFLFTLTFSTLQAQENLSYQVPSQEILNLADYERAPGVLMDSKKTTILFLYRNTYKSLEDLNQEELRLGGLRINPITNISSTATFTNNLKIRKMTEKAEVQVDGLPSSPRISNISWSPDEKKIAFTHTSEKGNELWIVDVTSAKAKKVSDLVLNANTGNPFLWCKDSQSLLVKVLPKNRPALIDSKKSIPTGPTVSVSDGVKSQNRTFQDLLRNKTDEANFETIVKSELYKVKLDGSSELFLPSDLYTGFGYSPDGNYLLLTTLQKPFSYIVPYYRFPMKTTVYDNSAKLVKVVNETPLLEVMPKGFMAVSKGKRYMNWRADHPASLCYIVALDDGDPAISVSHRDELFQWAAPFTTEPKSIMKTINRFSGIEWGNESYALVYDEWYDTRNTKTYLVSPSNPSKQPKILFDRNSQDIYSDPGSVEMTRNKYGTYVLSIQNDNIYFLGDGHTEKGQFPFIDEMNLKSGAKKRIYQSKLTDKMEVLHSMIDISKGDVLVQIQSKTEYPNYYIRNVKSKNQLTQITSFKNPFESIKDVHKEVIHYKRKDGVELSGTLYLPAGYDKTKKEKLPLLIWAYPTEFKDKSSAGQSTANPNEFTFPYYGSFVYWVTKGYAVLDDASFPIVGEGTTEPNDNFIEQLVDNADAAIKAVDELGYIDPKRVACGGHSYGAFMVANLLTHSDLFACGIARSGAYNRTLTPFGFQSEQRNYWDVPGVYNEMSPFMTADKMKHPLLLVHGEADNNPGTFTLQTERYFQALKGLGAPVRMVLLPKESHGYVAKENIFHLLWEQDQFLEKHLMQVNE